MVFFFNVYRAHYQSVLMKTNYVCFTIRFSDFLYASVTRVTFIDSLRELMLEILWTNYKRL